MLEISLDVLLLRLVGWTSPASAALVAEHGSAIAPKLILPRPSAKRITLSLVLCIFIDMIFNPSFARSAITETKSVKPAGTSDRKISRRTAMLICTVTSNIYYWVPNSAASSFSHLYSSIEDYSCNLKTRLPMEDRLRALLCPSSSNSGCYLLCI